MNANELVESRTFDTVPDIYPYEGRPILLLAWEVPDGFWRWCFGSFYEHVGYRYWEPRKYGMAATKGRAEADCRSAVENRDRTEWTAPAWAVNGGAGW